MHLALLARLEAALVAAGDPATALATVDPARLVEALTGPDGLDDAGALVAQHRGDGHPVRPLDGLEVGAADAAGAELDEYLSVFRISDNEVVVDHERGVELVQEGGAAGEHG